MTEREKNLRFLDALNAEQSQEAADKAAKRGPTPEERRELSEMRKRIDESFRAHRARVREEAAQSAGATTKASIPARILSMTRDALLARIAELRALATPGTPVLAEARKHVGDTPVDELSDSDLQWLVTAFEEQLGEPPSET